jgi:ribonucleoside-diphosphate reductase beta chain
LKTMGFASIFNTSDANPLPELAVMINAPTHTNFFENSSTDYSNVAVIGTWQDVWQNDAA